MREIFGSFFNHLTSQQKRQQQTHTRNAFEQPIVDWLKMKWDLSSVSAFLLFMRCWEDVEIDFLISTSQLFNKALNSFRNLDSDEILVTAKWERAGWSFPSWFGKGAPGDDVKNPQGRKLQSRSSQKFETGYRNVNFVRDLRECLFIS